MSVMLDPHLAQILNMLGFNWPMADEDKLKEAAQHWREFASEVGHIRGSAARHATQVGAENKGDAIDAFTHYWEGIGGPGGHLDQVQQAAEIVADVLDAFAVYVIGLKGDVAFQLGALALEIGADTVGAFFTFGATEAAAVGEVALTKIAMRELFDRAAKFVEEAVVQRLKGDVVQMFKKMLSQALRKALKSTLKGGMAGGGFAAATNLGMQAVQANVLHTQNGIKWGQVVTAGEKGAEGGAEAGAEESLLPGGDHFGKGQHADRQALDDLAAYRTREGMPVAGSAADRETASLLQIGDRQFFGKNAHGMPITMRVNAQTKTHAEAASFQQALNAKVKAEGATLYVDRKLCDACGTYGGIGSMLRQTGISEVRVIAPDGNFRITAARPSTPIPIEGPS